MNNSNRTSKKPVPDYIRQFLKQPPQLLKNFHYDDVMEFLKIADIKSYEAGEGIVEEGAVIESAYLVAEGTVTVWEDGVRLTSLEPGSFIGEPFLFSKNFRMSKVTSDGASRLLLFRRYDTLNFFRKKPEKMFNIFTRNVIEIQRQKIKETNEQLARLKKQLNSRHQQK